MAPEIHSAPYIASYISQADKHRPEADSLSKCWEPECIRSQGDTDSGAFQGWEPESQMRWRAGGSVRELGCDCVEVHAVQPCTSLLEGSQMWFLKVPRGTSDTRLIMRILGSFRIPQWNLSSKSCCFELFCIHIEFLQHLPLILVTVDMVLLCL